MQSLACGTLPLISARKFDNGLKGFVEVPKNRIREGHAITLKIMTAMAVPDWPIISLRDSLLTHT